MGLFKVFAWIFLLGLAAYIAYTFYLGVNAKASASGKAFLAPTFTSKCLDSDGKNYRVAGLVKAGKELLRDQCVEGKLVEYYCRGSLADRVIIPCKCRQGMCV